jgi:tetratricopeptide (TPR) repeat protein
MSATIEKMNNLEQLRQALAKHQAGELDAAKTMYLAVLAGEPRNADAHHLLGCAYRSERKLNEAIDSIGAAISIAPGTPTFYNNLGTCYSAKVELVAAELCFRKALALDPNYADAWSNLGLMLTNAMRFQDARAVLEQASVAAPLHEGILCNLAQVYHELAMTQKSLEVYQHVVKLMPASGNAWLGLAGCLNKLGQNDRALLAVEKLLTLDKKHLAEALQMKGKILEVMGRMDEACMAFDAAIEADPTAAGLMHARAAIKKIRSDEPFYRHLMDFEKRIDEFRGAVRGQLHFALGKAYQDTGDIASAASNYAQGASIQLLTSDYDEREDVTLFTAMHDHVNRELLDSLRYLGHSSDRPIFILGMPRSGTTLVEQILASHPDVCPAGELPYISEAFEGMYLRPGWKLGHPGGLEMPPDATLKQRAEHYLARVEAAVPVIGRRHFTDKLPENYYNLGLIAQMFPNARIIHCRRDPVDTCISCYNTLFAVKHYWSYDFGSLGRTYRRYWDLMQHWRNVLPGRFLELRYEQGVEDIELQARKLLEWCGLPWDDQVLRFYENDRPVITASVSQVRQPIYSSSVGKWKKWEPYIQPLLAEIGDIERQYWAEIGK